MASTTCFPFDQKRCVPGLLAALTVSLLMLPTLPVAQADPLPVPFPPEVPTLPPQLLQALETLDNQTRQWMEYVNETGLVPPELMQAATNVQDILDIVPSAMVCVSFEVGIHLLGKLGRDGTIVGVLSFFAFSAHVSLEDIGGGQIIFSPLLGTEKIGYSTRETGC